jgi:hypothetical protein
MRKGMVSSPDPMVAYAALKLTGVRSKMDSS